MIFQLPRWLRIQVSCLRQVLACFWFLFLFFLSFFLFCRSCRFQVAYSLLPGPPPLGRLLQEL